MAWQGVKGLRGDGDFKSKEVLLAEDLLGEKLWLAAESL